MPRLVPRFLILAALYATVAQAGILRTRPILDASRPKPSLHSFYFWRQVPGDQRFTLARLGADGRIEKSALKEKPAFDPQAAASGIFWPETKYSTEDLGLSRAVPSPDGQWTIQTFGIKTFADDLKNAFLIVERPATRFRAKIQVPANSMGTLYPLFWSPGSRYFYFMVMKGEVSSRTFGLWQYDTARRAFRNIGTTDGRAFPSPDGEWILWETGLLADECDTSSLHHDLHLVGYHVPEDLNYRLIPGNDRCLFHRWAP